MTQPPKAPDLRAQVQAHREEILYPSLFGGRRRGLFPMPPDMFTETFGRADYDPGWLRGGVFEFAPTERRASWVYVSSGLSDPWGTSEPDPASAVGTGGEIVLELPAQASWAILRLQYFMAYQWLTHAGRYPGQRPLEDYNQVSLGTNIGTEPSTLTWVMFAPPAFPRRYAGQSGWFDFSQMVGISETEAAAAQKYGGPQLVQALQREGAYPVTLPERKSIV